MNVAIGAVVVVVLLALFAMCHDSAKLREACERKGGVMVRTQHGDLCARLEIIK